MTSPAIAPFGKTTTAAEYKASCGDGSDARVCIVAPNVPSLSETFIRAHIERLPATVMFMHSWPPTIGERTIMSRPRRALNRVWRTVSGGKLDATTLAYLKVFRRFRPCAVLAEYGIMGVNVLAACRRAGLPLIVHFHGFDASMHEVLEANARTYPLLFREAESIIAVSRSMQRKLLGLGAPAEKVHYNPYGVDCQEFTRASPGHATPTFLAVGRFTPKKAPNLTLKAFAEVRRLSPAATLRMIGDGPLLNECQQLAKALAIEGAVTFLGAQPPAIVCEEMRRARCFVQHSVEAPSGDCEGTPVTILEAGASGLPVVSTSHGGIPDVIIEGQTGFLVDEHDVDGMAQQMLRLAQDPELAARLGQAARARIEDHFSMDRSIEQLWGIIRGDCARVEQNGQVSRVMDPSVNRDWL